jgi:hypothetical protein
MFIPDQNFFIQDPGSRVKKDFSHKKLFLIIWDILPGSRIRIFFSSRILDPGVKKAPDPEHWTSSMNKFASARLTSSGRGGAHYLLLEP